MGDTDFKVGDKVVSFIFKGIGVVKMVFNKKVYVKFPFRSGLILYNNAGYLKKVI